MGEPNLSTSTLNPSAAQPNVGQHGSAADGDQVAQPISTTVPHPVRPISTTVPRPPLPQHDELDDPLDPSPPLPHDELDDHLDHFWPGDSGWMGENEWLRRTYADRFSYPEDLDLFAPAPRMSAEDFLYSN